MKSANGVKRKGGEGIEMKKAIVMYASLSGNTEEVAELITDYLREYEVEVELFDIWEYEMGSVELPETSRYDAIFLGTYTWDRGGTPPEVKDFVADVGYKPENVFIFGTGETQFGEENYCTATDKLAWFYKSPQKPLKIEQSPRGSQEEVVKEWAERIIRKGTGAIDGENAGNINESKSVKSKESE